ncbi:hypothetical protein DSO57_1029311 [Entomophthora muscae]|uniref:Uncharacterized protein n=1 Tax=Entomophthora muscae TaxID=34485 RepID=A0ACC2RS80_9FUNG|nr:hypothetical protein DSO57_1029311 [Entomophthora muscae]
MEPPVTPKPMPASAAKLPLDHTNKLFGIVYITLIGVTDTIVPAAGPWLWLGKSMSYLIKLAPILWWALPTQSATCQFPNTSKLANQVWFPENHPKYLSRRGFIGSNRFLRAVGLQGERRSHWDQICGQVVVLVAE